MYKHVQNNIATFSDSAIYERALIISHYQGRQRKDGLRYKDSRKVDGFMDIFQYPSWIFAKNGKLVPFLYLPESVKDSRLKYSPENLQKGLDP